jgi:hypothetical protein
MSAESKARKACLQEAKQELARREHAKQESQAAQEVAHRKEIINGKLAGLQEERNRFIQETVALRKTNPEAAKIMIARGASIDAAILQAQKSLAMADSLGIERRIEDLIEESYSLIRKLKTEPVRFRTKKEIKKLKEESEIHSIMQELAERSRREEWAVYTDEIGSGAGSTFEADVLAAERQAEIDDIDD